MFLSKHSNRIYYLWFINERGKKQKVSTRCTGKSDALRFLQTFKREEYDRKQKSKRKLLSEFLTDFLSYAGGCFSKGTVVIYKAALQNFVSIVGDLPLISYTPQHFDTYKTIRQKPIKTVVVKKGHTVETVKVIKPVTINIELRSLRAFFNTAVRWKLLERSPFDIQLIKVPDTQPIFLTKIDLQILLSMIPESWLKEIVIFAVSTGLRRGEMINLKWNNVDLDRKLVCVVSTASFRTKSGKSRIVPLSETAMFILQARKRLDHTSEFVFSHNGNQILGGWMSHLFKRYVRNAKLGNQNIHFHSLRHSFASWLAQDGTSVYMIKDLLGHADVKTTQVYAHLQTEQMHREVNRINVSMN